MTELTEMTDEMILWGVIIFIAILLSNPKVYKVFLLLFPQSLIQLCLTANDYIKLHFHILPFSFEEFC
jgi:hypothetical protein